MTGYGERNLLKMHQFHKVELTQYVKPEDSKGTLYNVIKDAEKILQNLCLPYRIIHLCTADSGFKAADGYDIEVWLPYKNDYNEISSCFNNRDFAMRRANTRLKRYKTNKEEYVHIVSGSGLAVGRTVVAIIENYQQKDGSVTIPEVLIPFMYGVNKIH